MKQRTLTDFLEQGRLPDEAQPAMLAKHRHHLFTMYFPEQETGVTIRSNMRKETCKRLILARILRGDRVSADESIALFLFAAEDDNLSKILVLLTRIESSGNWQTIINRARQSELISPYIPLRGPTRIGIYCFRFKFRPKVIKPQRKRGHRESHGKGSAPAWQDQILPDTPKSPSTGRGVEFLLSALRFFCRFPSEVDLTDEAPRKPKAEIPGIRNWPKSRSEGIRDGLTPEERFRRYVLESTPRSPGRRKKVKGPSIPTTFFRNSSKVRDSVSYYIALERGLVAENDYPDQEEDKGKRHEDL